MKARTWYLQIAYPGFPRVTSISQLIYMFNNIMFEINLVKYLKYIFEMNIWKMALSESNEELDSENRQIDSSDLHSVTKIYNYPSEQQ